MSEDEFDAAKWTNRMTCRYHGEEREIVLVDFEEKLIGLRSVCDEGVIDYVRCQSVSDVTFPEEAND